ncbi:MAG TPA: hypothetical protein PK250_18530 [Syntrophobacter fumaroxidans]|nr:hypothetical protein [Syntrophobacter fumaroxidans]
MSDDKLEFPSMKAGAGSAIPRPPKPGSRGPIGSSQLDFPASPMLRQAEARAQAERLKAARAEYRRQDIAEKQVTRQRLRREGVDEAEIDALIGPEVVR